MGFKYLISVAVVLFTGISTNAGVDPLTAAAVTTNMAVLKGTYNERAKKQQKLAEIETAVAGGMAAIHGVEKRMLEYLSNISGALQNLYQIKRSAELMVEIPNNAAKLSEAVKYNPKGAVLGPIITNELTRLASEATTLYPFMRQLVTSGTYNSGEDKHNVNLLNSAERFYIANMVVSKLENINTCIIVLRYQIQYARWDDLLRKLDPESWGMIWDARATMRSVAYDWKYFKLRNKYRNQNKNY